MKKSNKRITAFFKQNNIPHEPGFHCINGLSLDHCELMEMDSCLALVSHEYPKTKEWFVELLQVCDRYDLFFEVWGKSEYNPGETFKLVIYRNPA